MAKLTHGQTYHQLHCVYYLFRNLHPEYFKIKHTIVAIDHHIDHCIDSLRQVSGLQFSTLTCYDILQLTKYDLIVHYVSCDN